MLAVDDVVVPTAVSGCVEVALPCVGGVMGVVVGVVLAIGTIASGVVVATVEVADAGGVDAAIGVSGVVVLVGVEVAVVSIVVAVVAR